MSKQFHIGNTFVRIGRDINYSALQLLVHFGRKDFSIIIIIPFIGWLFIDYIAKPKDK